MDSLHGSSSSCAEKPAALRLDCGSELTSHAFIGWARERGIELRYRTREADQNAIILRFNKTYRTEV